MKMRIQILKKTLQCYPNLNFNKLEIKNNLESTLKICQNEAVKMACFLMNPNKFTSH